MTMIERDSKTKHAISIVYGYIPTDEARKHCTIRGSSEPYRHCEIFMVIVITTPYPTGLIVAGTIRLRMLSDFDDIENSILNE